MAIGQCEMLDANPLSPDQWEKWVKLRYNCESFTSILREQVPVLDYVKWEVTKIDQGLAHSMLPLVSTATNQHCTHQAALFFLAADYTGGIALASLLPHYPIGGVHPIRSTEKTMALWLVKGEIRYARPSVGLLDIIARIDPDRHERIRRRFIQGKAVLETITIYFRNGDITVAEADLTYFARQSHMLRSDGVEPEKVNTLYQHKLISSAELIAGVRAKENGRLFHDPYATQIAREHGLALANRFCEKLPQLGGMVAARTRHLDQEIMDFVKRGGRNLVLLGAGYDMRPFRLNFAPGMIVYELDFSSVLIDRQKRLNEFSVKDPAGMKRILIPIDLRSTSLTAALKDCVDFTIPIFIAWEGMSMYFEEAEVRKILQGILPVVENENSRIWIDFVTEQAVQNPEIFPEVKAFMHGMQLLGEPFTFGTDSIKDFMQSNGFLCRGVVPSDVFFENHSDPVYSVYNFCVASADTACALILLWFKGHRDSFKEKVYRFDS